MGKLKLKMIIRLSIRQKTKRPNHQESLRSAFNASWINAEPNKKKHETWCVCVYVCSNCTNRKLFIYIYTHTHKKTDPIEIRNANIKKNGSNSNENGEDHVHKKSNH